MEQQKMKVILSMEFGNHLIERLLEDKTSQSFYYLVDKIPVISNVMLEYLSEEAKDEVFREVAAVWQPNFIVQCVSSGYCMARFEKPYVLYDRHVYVNGALIHYDSETVMNEKYVLECAADIADQIRSSCLIFTLEMGHMRARRVEPEKWSEKMQDIFGTNIS